MATESKASEELPLVPSRWTPANPDTGGRPPTDEDAKMCGNRFAVTWYSGLVSRDLSAAQVRAASNHDIIAWMPDPIPSPYIPSPPKPSTERRSWWINEYSNGVRGAAIHVSRESARAVACSDLIRTIQVREVLPGDPDDCPCG